MPQVFRHASFRWLWLSQTLSTIGDRMVVVVLALYLTERTGDPSALAIVLAAYTTPLVLLLAVAGVWADRVPRNRLMLAADLVRFGLHATLALLILADAAPLAAVAAIEAMFGAAEAFFRPASTGLLPQTVPEELIQEANAMTSVSANAAEFLGPAVGTAVVAGAGAGYAYAFDAATFLLSALALAFVRPRRRKEEDAPPRLGMIAELKVGWQVMSGRSWIWVSILVLSLSMVTGFAPWAVLGPNIARQDYDQIALFGVISASVGAGTIIGALIGLKLMPRRPMAWAILVSLFWPLLLLAFAAQAPVVLSVALAVAAGAGLSLFNVWWLTCLAHYVPPSALSRVAAWDWMGTLGLLPIGYLVVGAVSDVAPDQEILLAGAAATLLIILAGLLPRQTRTLAAPGAASPAA